MSKSKLPKHILRLYGSGRQFKVGKRVDAAYAEQSINDLITGCAYTPAHKEIDQLRTLMRAIRWKLSAKEWGR